jgi:CBS domain-containing protein
VHPEDPAELAASIMYWKQVRHLPVEDAEGRLVGVLSYRSVLKLMAESRREPGEPVPVREIMRANPLTVAGDTSCLDAIRLMVRHGVSSLPVLERGRLVGIITDRDFTRAAAHLFEEELTRTPAPPRRG